IQFTSGCTGLPKAIVIEHGQLVENCRGICNRSQFTHNSKWVSWLPVHDDMGLIGGLLTPLSTEASLVLLPTDAFLRSPASWLRAISEHKGTDSAAPPFAYQLLCRPLYSRTLSAVDLT